MKIKLTLSLHFHKDSFLLLKNFIFIFDMLIFLASQIILSNELD